MNDSRAGTTENRPRVIVRKHLDPYAPILHIELLDGRSFTIGGQADGQLRDRGWTQQVFLDVENGKHSDWELLR